MPFSIVYGLVVWVRNRLFDWGWIKSTGFGKPVIVVGNLAVGGTGKSPMTEHLVKMLAGRYRIATLSRGYGRKTRGYVEVSEYCTAAQCGDEPLQFKRKFPHIKVAVDEDRVRGVRRLLREGHDLVILDDAYQHRTLRPGLAILLFDYRSFSRPKWLLPAGNFRDCFRERRRADVMVVTKTPPTADEADRQRIRQRLSLKRPIPVLFASIQYGQPVPVFRGATGNTALLTRELSVLLVTGIADPSPLLSHLKQHVREVEHLRFPDHHPYTSTALETIRTRFHAIRNPSRIVITTEKDAQRLSDPTLPADVINGLPLYLIPIQVQFDQHDGQIFQDLILNYCNRVAPTH